MKILITGAAGFLGLHLAGYFSNKNHQLILLDISDYPPHEYSDSCRLEIGDVRDEIVVDKLCKEVDVIIHGAAALPLWSTREIFSTNKEGTRNILKQALKNKVKQVIFISSTAVYGVPKKHPIVETDPLVGVGAYGQSKIEAESICQKYREKGLLVTIIRPKTFIGTHRLGVFEILYDWVKDGKKIPVIGNGNNRYQLLDVDDLAEAIYLFATAKKKNRFNQNFNIGAEKFGSVSQDLQALFDFAKSGSTIIKTPARPIKIILWLLEKLKLSPLYQWIYDTADKDSYVSINRLVKTLNWRPRYSNAQALIKSYRWYLNHYQEIKSRGSGITHTVGWKQGILGFFKRFL